jgi:hypothetical protein
MELEPKRNAALENKVPKLEPNVVMRTEPLSGKLVPWTDETTG